MMSHNVRMLINIYHNVACEDNEVEKSKQFINETINQQRIKLQFFFENVTHTYQYLHVVYYYYNSMAYYSYCMYLLK